MGFGSGVFVAINLINLINVRMYGETEFWFAIIKVLAIVGMIFILVAIFIGRVVMVVRKLL